MSERNLSTKRILAVLAHPDDEAFGMGGTLAHYAKRGAQVFLVCATLGEAGMVSAEFLKNGKTIAEVRGNELTCSAQALGIEAPILLGYQDSGAPGKAKNLNPKALLDQTIENVAGKIAMVMCELHPNVVLTFDALGGSKHPDHIFIHRATLMAFEQYQTELSEQSAQLFFHVMPRHFNRVGCWLLHLIGKEPHKLGPKGLFDQQTIAKSNFPTHVRINYRDVQDEQARASACHASQGGNRQFGPLARLFTSLFSRPVDCFMQAYPKPTKTQAVRTYFWET